MKNDYWGWNLTYHFVSTKHYVSCNAKSSKKCNYWEWNFFWFYQHRTLCEIKPPIIGFLLELLIPHSTLLKLIPRANYPWGAGWAHVAMAPWGPLAILDFTKQCGVPHRPAARICAICLYLDNCICYIYIETCYTLYMVQVLLTISTIHCHICVVSTNAYLFEPIAHK